MKSYPANVTVEKRLKQLQQAAREKHQDLSGWRQWTQKVPTTGEEPHVVVFGRTVCDLIDTATPELIADLRFEHMKKPNDALLDFAGEAATVRQPNHVPQFVKQHARAIEDLDVIFPVIHLQADEPLHLHGAVLLPVDDPGVPDVPYLKDVKNCRGYLSVPSRGTNHALIAARARIHARKVLAALRVGMASQIFMHGRQLRFRLGETYAFNTKQFGWKRDDDSPLGATLNRDVFDRVMAQRTMGLPVDRPAQDLAKHARLAADWINRSLLVGEPLVAMLYQFFALEAMLGDRADKLKGQRLAFRRTVLAEVVTGHWPGPWRIYELYEKVRSAAVHGSETPEISVKAASGFKADVLRTLEEYLMFASERDLTSRSQVLEALNNHAVVPALLQRLRELDTSWNDFSPTAGDASGE